MNPNQYGNYNNITPQMMAMMRSGMNNFQQAFIPHQTLIDRPDLRNRGQILHNNIGDLMLTEHLTEYHIHVDSADRNTSVYNNPFNFTLIFGGIGTSIERKFGHNSYSEKTYTGAPQPFLSQKFKNIKYVKLETIVLPKTNTINVSDDPDPTYTIGDADTDLTTYRYLLLRIKELKSPRVLSTNSAITEDCFILYPDTIMGTNACKWIPTIPFRIYKNSILHNLERLTFELLDDEGNLLFSVDQDGNRLDMARILADLEDNKDPDDPILVNFTKLYKMMRMTISFTLGVVESEMNTNTKYES